MGGAMHRQPFLAGELFVGDGGARAGLNTSAPPPGRLVTPASCSAITTSVTDSFSMRARCAISTAVSALMCTSGWRALRPRNMST